MHNYSNMRNKQMVNKNMPNFTLFQNFADSCLQNDSFFLDFANSPFPLKKYPFFAKMGTSVVYVLVGGDINVRSLDSFKAHIFISKIYFETLSCKNPSSSKHNWSPMS